MDVRMWLRLIEDKVKALRRIDREAGSTFLFMIS
jgi:hypothetical protein